LVYRGREEIAALLLCSRVREDVGHVTQICVSRRYRQRGLGSWLLAECSRALRSRGFQALTLTVTRQNSEAVALYHRSGFITRQTFDAMVWERRGRGRS
jgi:ribosomal protein S18 acetylase RimI-like enzyme